MLGRPGAPHTRAMGTPKWECGRRCREDGAAWVSRSLLWPFAACKDGGGCPLVAWQQELPVRTRRLYQGGNVVVTGCTPGSAECWWREAGRQAGLGARTVPLGPTCPERALGGIQAFPSPTLTLQSPPPTPVMPLGAPNTVLEYLRQGLFFLLETVQSPFGPSDLCTRCGMNPGKAIALSENEV